MNINVPTLEMLEKNINHSVINSHEKQELVDTILVVIEDLILSDPMLCAKSNYREILCDNIKELLEIQLENILPIVSDYYVEETIDKIINESFYLYHRFFAPKREYGDTFIRKKPNVEKMKVNQMRILPKK